MKRYSIRTMTVSNREKSLARIRNDLQIVASSGPKFWHQDDAVAAAMFAVDQALVAVRNCWNVERWT